GLVTLRWCSPGTHRIAAGRGLAFTATMRMVDRIHRDAANRRTLAAPAHPAGFTDGFEVVFLVADFSDGGTAIDVHLADLAGAQPQLGIDAFACQQLHRSAGRTRQLRALARLHFNAVNRGADRNIAQRQGVSRLDGSFRAIDDFLTDGNALRRDHVPPFAVGVTQQCKSSASVRVVFETFDLGRDAVLVAHEVDDTIVLFVATALMTRRDMAAVVAACALALLFDQRGNRLALVQMRVDDLDECPPARRCRFDFDQCHYLVSPAAKLISWPGFRQ